MIGPRCGSCQPGASLSCAAAGPIEPGRGLARVGPPRAAPLRSHGRDPNRVPMPHRIITPERLLSQPDPRHRPAVVSPSTGLARNDNYYEYRGFELGVKPRVWVQVHLGFNRFFDGNTPARQHRSMTASRARAAVPPASARTPSRSDAGCPGRNHRPAPPVGAPAPRLSRTARGTAWGLAKRPGPSLPAAAGSWFGSETRGSRWPVLRSSRTNR